MLVKFFSHGNGNGHSCINYLLGRKRNRKDARVLNGNTELTLALTSKLKFQSKYTSGVLSFEEDNIPEHQKAALMSYFEKSIFPDMAPGDYNILWVEHLDKKRLELNFVIPKIHLPTGRQLHVYSHQVDMPLTRSFKRLMNHEFGFTEPEDLSKIRGLTNPQNMPLGVKEFRQQLNVEVEHRINSGAINNRDELIKWLDTSGFTVARITQKSISIKNAEGKKNIRLTGAHYAQSFAGQLKPPSEQSKAAKTIELRKDYKTQINKRSERNAIRYKTISADWARLERRVIEAAHSLNSDVGLLASGRNLVTGRTGNVDLLSYPLQMRLKFHERDRKNTIDKIKTSVERAKRKLNRNTDTIKRITETIRGNVRRFGRLIGGSRAERIERIILNRKNNKKTESKRAWVRDSQSPRIDM